MLTIRTTRTAGGVEQFVYGHIGTDAELDLWAEASGHSVSRDLAGEPYAVIPLLANEMRGGVAVRRGSFVSWWVTV